jgi:hypothetical protein
MKVKALKRKLERFDDDLEVVIEFNLVEFVYTGHKVDQRRMTTTAVSKVKANDDKNKYKIVLFGTIER